MQVIEKLQQLFVGYYQPQQQQQMDLSYAPDHWLISVLLRVSVNDLLKNCVLVSKKWNELLTDNEFWRRKAELDDYPLDWPQLAGLSLRSYQAIAAKHPFGRNLIRDRWDLSKRNVGCYIGDTRWERSGDVLWTEDDSYSRNGNRPRIEVPSMFLDGTQIVHPEPDEEVIACLATSYQLFSKKMQIKLSDEGLTDDIMDKLQPTIVVTELVANRKDCASRYKMHCHLSTISCRNFLKNDSQLKEKLVEESELHFKQWEDEGWRRVKHEFRDYPIGMRYLFIYTEATDSQFWAGYYGAKMANICVKAFYEGGKKILPNK